MSGGETAGGERALGVGLSAGTGRIWGMSGAERLDRIFRRVGLTPAGRDALAANAQGSVLLARADWVFDESLIAALAKRSRAVLVAPSGQVVAAHCPAIDAAAAAEALEVGEDPAARLAGFERLDLEALAYNEVLRKREPPVLTPLDAANVRQVEARLFKGSYKGVTDLVTKYVWPTPARIVTRWCALIGITPNQVTLAGLVLVIAAFALFWTGHFGWGLVCGWIMTFLDTVDGKLARVTLTSSKVGNILDHGIDLIHPPFWWWAWLVGVQIGPHPVTHTALILWILWGGYIAQRIEEGVFIKLFGFHMHAWRPFDSWFRLITARRNPNMILLTATALVGRPDLGLIAITAWTAASFFVHLAQIVQAALLPRGQVTSWLTR